MAYKIKGTVYVIAGPTAVGKSDIAFHLAGNMNGEIINCDSVQLYKYMDIGSAMPPAKQMELVPHHLYAVIEPTYNIAVAEYQKLAFAAIDDVLSRGKTPIVTGGTGLYMHSILYDMDFASRPGSEERRAELELLAEQKGPEYMFEYLSAVDPDSAARIHPNNTRRVVRAIEAYEQGSSIRDMDSCSRNHNYDFKLYGLNMDREWLYNRINSRVIDLVKAGLIDEVKNLLDMGLTCESPSMKGIGYKELIGYIEGRSDLKDCVLEIMKNTRHYAKRQITWLKRYEDMEWIEIVPGETIGDVIKDIMSR